MAAPQMHWSSMFLCRKVMVLWHNCSCWYHFNPFYMYIKLNHHSELQDVYIIHQHDTTATFFSSWTSGARGGILGGTWPIWAIVETTKVGMKRTAATKTPHQGRKENHKKHIIVQQENTTTDRCLVSALTHAMIFKLLRGLPGFKKLIFGGHLAAS